MDPYSGQSGLNNSVQVLPVQEPRGESPVLFWTIQPRKCHMSHHVPLCPHINSTLQAWIDVTRNPVMVRLNNGGNRSAQRHNDARSTVSPWGNHDAVPYLLHFGPYKTRREVTHQDLATARRKLYWHFGPVWVLPSLQRVDSRRKRILRRLGESGPSTAMRTPKPAAARYLQSEQAPRPDLWPCKDQRIGPSLLLPARHGERDGGGRGLFLPGVTPLPRPLPRRRVYPCRHTCEECR